MELRAFIDVLRRWWLTFLGAALIGGAAGYVSANQLPEHFESHAKVLVGPVNAEIDTIRAAASLTETYAQLASSEVVVSGAIDELALAISSEDLREAMEVRTDQTTRIVTIGVEADDPQLAADLANAIARGLLPFATPASGPEGELTVIDSALPGDHPVGPGPLLLAGLAVIGALLAAALITIAIEYVGGRVRGAYDLHQLVPARFLGRLEQADGRRMNLLGPAGIRIESAALLSRLLTQGNNAKVHSLLVPAIDDDDGTAGLAIELAQVAAASGMRVVIVDANDLDPEVTELMGLHSGDGAIADGRSSTPLLGRTQYTNPTVLRELSAPADPPPEPLTAALGDGYDLAVIHTAPLHRSGLAVRWAQRVDAAVLAANIGHTHREFLRHAVEALEHSGALIAGSIILTWRRTDYADRHRDRADQFQELAAQ